MVTTDAARTKHHVATWKKPSASVLACSPDTVSIGSLWLTMWCHCRIWCSTMPSTNPPRPIPYMRPGAREGRSVRWSLVTMRGQYPARNGGRAWRSGVVEPAPLPVEDRVLVLVDPPELRVPEGLDGVLLPSHARP